MSQPIPILIVTTELGMGGAERAVANLACRLDRTRFAARVVVLDSPPEPPKDGLVTQLESTGIPLTFLNCRSKWQLFSAVRKLKRIVREQQPQVVISFLFHANVVTALATRGMNLIRLPALRVIEQGWWRRKLQTWSARGAGRILCVSEGVRSFAEHSLKLPPEKLVVIPNAVDLASIEPNPYGPPTDRRHRILAVGRLHEQKGFDWLIFRLAALLREKPDWELVILGEGDQVAELTVQIESEGLNDSVRLEGWKNDLPRWFATSEVFALSSRWEGMPNALIEAMAHGLPVMATNVEGVAELLSGNLSEQIVNHWEMPEAEAFLRRLMEDSQLRENLGKANRKQIQTHFSFEQIVPRYEQLIEQVLKQHSPQR